MHWLLAWGAVFLGVDHLCVGETPLVMLIDLEGVRILLDFGKRGNITIFKTSKDISAHFTLIKDE